MNLQAGQILGDKYRIVRQIGQGGMGCVYEGENTRIRRRIAIKTLHAHVAGKSDVLQRFEREAQAAGRIGSDHIVEVLDMGDLPDGSRFMVMEFLEGTTLSDRIVSQGRINPRDVVSVLTQLLDGLGAAHQAGIIHRDLKPANVFLLTKHAGRPDFVKILDFGVSKFNILNSDEMSMTRTGAVMGTPYYMSPEQAKGAREIDARSDLYSVGVILYEAVTGQVPFNAETFNELIFKIALESPPPPEQFVPSLDPAFGALMRKAMGRDPSERYQTAAELKEALLGWARDFDARGGHPVPPGPRAGMQMLPIVGAMRPGYGSSPHGVAATIVIDPGAAGRNPAYGPGATQLVHAGAPVVQGQEGRLPKRSVAAVLFALGAALFVGVAAAVVLYGRSSNATAGTAEEATEIVAPTTSDSETASRATVSGADAEETTASTTVASTTVASTAAAASDAETSSSTLDPTASGSVATPSIATSTTGPRTTNRYPFPTAIAKPPATATATATATAAKPSGREIRPDL